MKEVARLGGQGEAPKYEKAGDLASFFTVGVKPVQPKDRVMTPSGQRKKDKQPEAGIEKWKVSNKCECFIGRGYIMRAGFSLSFERFER